MILASSVFVYLQGGTLDAIYEVTRLGTFVSPNYTQTEPRSAEVRMITK